MEARSSTRIDLLNGFEGRYFDEMISLVVKMTSIRTILSLVVVEYLHLEQLDVKINFSPCRFRGRNLSTTTTGV